MTWIIALRMGPGGMEGDAGGEGDVGWNMRTTDMHSVRSRALTIWSSGWAEEQWVIGWAEEQWVIAQHQSK